MIRPTRTILGGKAKEFISRGVNAVYQPVRKTFGPEGMNALIYRTMNRGVRITNDGVTVAEVQEPKNQFVRQAAQAFKEACKRTNEKVGDGTTCTVIVGGQLFNDIYNTVNESMNAFTTNKKGVMSLKKEILDAAGLVKEQITKSSKKIISLKQLEKIAIVSVEDEELGKTIAEMAWACGVDGFIDVVEGYKGEIETEIIKGMRFPAKVPAKAFVNNASRFEMVAEDCPILITNYKLDNVAEFGKQLNEIGSNTSKVIIVAPSFSQNVLVNFANAIKSGFHIFPVLAPSMRTDQLEDLAVYCDATFIDKNKGKRLQNVTFKDLGFIGKVVVKDTELKEDAIITGGRGTMSLQVEGEEKAKAAVEERLETLKKQLVETKQQQFKKLLERRIASMASAIGVIRVGDSTQASSLYRKLKIEDAVYACKAALRGGYVKGGGLCLKEIADKLSDGHVLKNALLAPYKQIQASVDGGVEISEDIIDPAQAIFYAVEHATQVVAQLITVDSLVIEIEDPLPGEGEHAMAAALREFVMNDKINKGLITAGQAEMERDTWNGMNENEYYITHRDG